VPVQHGGATEKENLALACIRCNRFKGPNVGSFDPQSGELVPFYDPRRQKWSEHFVMKDGYIHPLTPETRVTIKILRINDEERVEERANLLAAGLILLERIKT
jgi:hypothetical protein